MQLAHAARVEEILPGDPDQVLLLARMVTEFAESASEARRTLQRSGLGGWTGAAAQAAEHELIQLNDRLTKAEAAFDEAGEALAAYARAHGQARDEAARALELWQSAAPASAILHGTAVGAMPADAPPDPDAVLARAGAMAQDARAYLVTAGRTLHRVLDEAKEHAPKDPGLFAKLRRAVASFGLGLFEGSVVEPIEGLVAIGKLTVALDPMRAIYDPEGFLKVREELALGMLHAIENPDKVGAALIDLEGWKEDPVKTFGKFLPDLIALGAAWKAGGILGKAEAIERTEANTQLIKDIGRDAVYDRVDAADVARVLESRGIEPGSAVGDALTQQLTPPFGGLDPWEAARLEPGQKVAVINGGQAFVPFDDTLPFDATEFFERYQIPSMRYVLDDGTTSLAKLPPSVEIYRVSSHEPIDAARAIAEANTQFGAGGGVRYVVPDGYDLIGDERMFEHVNTHSFTSGLNARTEDPLYRAVDPAYQGIEPHDAVRALNPTHEKWVGRFEGLREKGVETVRDNVVKSGAVAAVGRADRGDE